MSGMIANSGRTTRVGETGIALAIAMLEEGKLEIAKAELLDQLTAGFIGQADGNTGKVHSATSAVAAARATDMYRKEQHAVLDATYARVLAGVRYECARINAWAEVNPVGGP